MKTINGNWVLPNGSPVSNGVLFLHLSQAAVVSATPTQVAQHSPIAITLDINGTIPAGTVILANDELLPAGTFYRMTLNMQGGGRIYGPQTITITGNSPINLNTFTPRPGP